MSSPAAWDPKQIYRLGELVTLSTSTWVCTRDYNLNNAPSTSSVWWGAVTGPAAGVTTIGTTTAAFPAVPPVNQSSTTTISLVAQEDLEAGALYWIACGIIIRPYNSDDTVQAVQFVDSLDVLGIQLTCPTLNFGVSNSSVTLVGLRDRPGQLNAADQYPQWLTCQLTSADLSGPLQLNVVLQNKSGTMSYGTASALEITVYKV